MSQDSKSMAAGVLQNVRLFAAASSLFRSNPEAAKQALMRMLQGNSPLTTAAHSVPSPATASASASASTAASMSDGNNNKNLSSTFSTSSSSSSSSTNSALAAVRQQLDTSKSTDELTDILKKRPARVNSGNATSPLDPAPKPLSPQLMISASTVAADYNNNPYDTIYSAIRKFRGPGVPTASASSSSAAGGVPVIASTAPAPLIALERHHASSVLFDTLRAMSQAVPQLSASLEQTPTVEYIRWVEPNVDADFEEMQCIQAGPRPSPYNKALIIIAPPCSNHLRKGTDGIEGCRIEIDRIGGFDDVNRPGLTPQQKKNMTGGVPVMAYMRRMQLMTFFRTGELPAEWLKPETKELDPRKVGPCLFCRRAMITNLVLNLHASQTDLTRRFRAQTFYNTVDSPGGYLRDFVLMPKSGGKYNGLVAPIAMYRKDALRAIKDPGSGLFMISQRAMRWPSPDVSESPKPCPYPWTHTEYEKYASYITEEIRQNNLSQTTSTALALPTASPSSPSSTSSSSSASASASTASSPFPSPLPLPLSASSSAVPSSSPNSSEPETSPPNF